jgi:hypothetical protein
MKLAPHFLTYCSSFLTLVFAVTSTAVHFAQPGFNPVDVALSFYLNGYMGWILATGLVALGTGSLFFVAAMYTTLGGEAPRTWVGVLSAWGLACVFGGLFPPDPYGHWDRPPSLSGAIHGIAAIVAFLSFPIAAVYLSKFCGSATASRAATLCAGLTVLFFVCLAPVFLNRPPYALGLVERAALGAYILWLLIANRALRNGCTLRQWPKSRTSAGRLT